MKVHLFAGFVPLQCVYLQSRRCRACRGDRGGGLCRLFELGADFGVFLGAVRQDRRGFFRRVGGHPRRFRRGAEFRQKRRRLALEQNCAAPRRAEKAQSVVERRRGPCRAACGKRSGGCAGLCRRRSRAFCFARGGRSRAFGRGSRIDEPRGAGKA